MGYEFTTPGFRTPPYTFEKPFPSDGLKPTILSRTPSHEWPAASPPYPYQEGEESAFRTPKRLEFKFDSLSEETGFEQRMQDPTTWHGPMLDFGAITNDGSAILSAMPLFVPPGCPNPYQGALFDTQQESAMTDKPHAVLSEQATMQEKPLLLDSQQVQQQLQQQGFQQISINQHQHGGDQFKKFPDLAFSPVPVQKQSSQQQQQQQPQQVFVFEAPQVAASPLTLPESKQHQIANNSFHSGVHGSGDTLMVAAESQPVPQESQTEPVLTQDNSDTNYGKKPSSKRKRKQDSPLVKKHAAALRDMLQKFTDEMDLSGTLSSIAGLPVTLKTDSKTGEQTLGKYTMSQRKLRIAKFKAKFAGKRPTGPRKKFLYASRSRFAKSRKRRGGRFVSKGNQSPGDDDDYQS